MFQKLVPATVVFRSEQLVTQITTDTNLSMLMSVPSLVFVTPLPNTITNPKRICWNAYGLSVLLPNMTLKLAAVSKGFQTMCALVIFPLVNYNGLMIGLEIGSP